MRRLYALFALLSLSCSTYPNQVRLSGVVEADPILVVSPADGILASVDCTLGEPVEAGRTLARINSPGLDDQLARLKAHADSAENALALARQQRENAQADLELRERASSGIRRRVEGGRLVDQPSESDDLRRDLARARLDLAETHELSARSALEQAVIALDFAQSQAAKLALTSPVAGSVASVAGPVGRPVLVGETVVTIYDLTELWVDVWVEESLAPQLETGDAVTAQSTQGEISGAIQSISPAAEFAVQRDVDRFRRDVRAFRVRIRLEGEDLRPGTTVDVFLPGN